MDTVRDKGEATSSTGPPAPSSSTPQASSSMDPMPTPSSEDKKKKHEIDADSPGPNLRNMTKFVENFDGTISDGMRSIMRTLLQWAAAYDRIESSLQELATGNTPEINALRQSINEQERRVDQFGRDLGSSMMESQWEMSIRLTRTALRGMDIGDDEIANEGVANRLRWLLAQDDRTEDESMIIRLTLEEVTGKLVPDKLGRAQPAGQQS
ncbi:unnamed protein product [Penicillium bialowiezense]